MNTAMRLTLGSVIGLMILSVLGCGGPTKQQTFADPVDHPKRPFVVAETAEQRFDWALPESLSMGIGENTSLAEGVSFQDRPDWTPREDLLRGSRLAVWEPISGGLCVVAVWPNDLGGIEGNATRWRSQVGGAEGRILEIPVAGGTAHVFDARGPVNDSMLAVTLAEGRLMGALVPLTDGRYVTAKLLLPAAASDNDAITQGFIELITSLRTATGGRRD